MHWFGELLGFYIAIAGVGFGILYVRKFPAYKAQREAAMLKYIERADWRRSWQELYNANISAIDALERDLAPGFPENIREQLLKAHEAASTVTRGITAYEKR